MKKALLLLALLATASFAWSQDNSPKVNSVGLLVGIGYPDLTNIVNATTAATIGLNIFLGNDFCLRPEVNFGLKIVTQIPGSPDVKANTSVNFGVSLTGLYELHPVPNFLVGIGGNIGLQFDSENVSYKSSYINGVGYVEDLTTLFNVALVLDLQYSFSKVFGIFADTGLNFSTSSTTNSSSYNTSTFTGAATSTLGLYRTSVGVVFYF